MLRDVARFGFARYQQAEEYADALLARIKKALRRWRRC